VDESDSAEATNHPDSELVEAILNASDGEFVTLQNLIQVKQIRESRVNIHSGTDYPSKLISRISRGEAILTMSAMGETDTKISVERVKTWFGEDKLPEGYVPRSVD
jgi:hypothetical protein